MQHRYGWIQFEKQDRYWSGRLPGYLNASSFPNQALLAPSQASYDSNCGAHIGSLLDHILSTSGLRRTEAVPATADSATIPAGPVRWLVRTLVAVL